MNFCLVQDRQGQDEKENALFVTCSMCRDSKSSFEITQYVCKTQGHLSLEEGGMGENWSLRILEELELKLECADARAASLG